MDGASRRSPSRTDVPYLVILVVCCLLGMIATVCLQEIERKVIPWKAE